MVATDRIDEIRQQTELLTQTGPGTPGGALLRRYWQPVILTRDFSADSPPQPVRLLSEDLVLFRDRLGRPGLLGLRCAHRGVDLSYGRVEDGGLRCIYHGWLYDLKGRCLEQPGEPQGGLRRDHVRQKAYPCVERGGAVWTYMGPGEPPLFPNYPALVAPDDYRHTIRFWSNCNYLQGNEGEIDPVHTSYLHRMDLKRSWFRDSIAVFGVDTTPKLSVRSSRFGARIFTERRMPAGGQKVLRVTNFVMPNACAIGGFESGLGRGGCSMFWHVPIDDAHHWRYDFIFHSKVPLPKSGLDRMHESERMPDGRLRRNAENRYLQKREDMQSTWLGMGENFAVHDLFVTESQGEIADRTQEHLVTSDIAIVRSRREMLVAVRDVQDGKDPLGVLRRPEENDCRDLLVLTETLDDGVDNDRFCAQLEQQNIYELNLEIANRASVLQPGE